MSTTAHTLHAVPAGGSAPAESRPPLSRLVDVELRKSVDTRAGRWLVIAIAAITAIVALATALTGAGSDRDLQAVLGNTLIGTGVLLPVVAILSVTSEWSQRTALATFTLVPDRGRVVLAKAAATTILAVGAFAFALVVAVAATLLRGATGGDGATLSVPLAHLGEAGVFVLLNVAIGFAFAVALLASAPAIVAYFVLPTIWGVATSSVSALDGLGRWLDTSRSFTALSDGGASATEWAHVAASTGLWLVLPLAYGLWRVRRAEVA